jgi:hypothetical protein
MTKLNSVLMLVLLVFAGLIGTDARSAELEGALQYPPRSIGDDAQPLPPARMAPPLVFPWRIELGVSGSSVPPGTQRFFLSVPQSVGRDLERRPAGSGGG